MLELNSRASDSRQYSARVAAGYFATNSTSRTATQLFEDKGIELFTKPELTLTRFTLETTKQRLVPDRDVIRDRGVPTLPNRR